MKRFLLLILILMTMASYAKSATVTVTLTTDNVTTPTPGMLRYCIKNAATGDIIKFAVDRVDLVGEIPLSDKSITIDGTDRGKVIIDGGSLGRIFRVSQYSRTSKTYLKNLILQNGKKDGDFGMGGAVDISVSFGGIVEFDQCIFQNNVAFSNSDGQGGAVRCDGGLFKNCQFLNNSVTGTAYSNAGGAVLALGGTFINCLFVGNSARHGGAVYAAGAVNFYNCTLTQNQCAATASGGGLTVDDASATFVNCVVFNNKADGVINNVNQFNGFGVIKNCAFETGNVLVGSNGNIGLSASPFIGSGTYPFALIPGTACVNSGSSTSITVLSADLAGNTRVIGDAIDMGAYESGAATSIGSNTVRQTIIYPNPTSGLIYFSDVLGKDATVQIIDVAGKIVVDKRRIDGISFIDLSGRKGIYIAVIVDRGQSTSTKIVVQ
jgi:predicted outer membrane repeat protein